MPELELDANISFDVDQLTIDRVEALAAIEGLDLSAWFRRLVDDLVAQGSRHMGIDHIEIDEVRGSVLEIIEWISEQVHPLRSKARAFLENLSILLRIKKSEEEASADEDEDKKESTLKKVAKKLKPKKLKKIKKKEPEPEPEPKLAEEKIEEAEEELIELAEEDEEEEEEFEEDEDEE